MEKLKTFEQFIGEDSKSNGSIVNEYDTRNFAAATPDKKLISGAKKWLKKYMPRTEKTTEEATKRIESFNGGTMFTHVQYHEVKPYGNAPDRPEFRLSQSQEWLNDAQLAWMNRRGEEVNATLLTIYDITNGDDQKEKIGQIYVDTKAFLDEMNRVFEIRKRAS
jgi:hypothetical protein